MNKKVAIIITAILCVALICGAFFFASQKNKAPSSADGELTEVEKLITKNLSSDYPATPREVVKLYNRIITAYYAEEMSDDELSDLTSQALLLFDDELAAINPSHDYLVSVKAEISQYKNSSKLISQSNVCDSRDVLYITNNGDEIAYVTASYFIKEGNNYSRSYETYVLRKDAEGKWKILVYYQTQAPTKED